MRGVLAALALLLAALAAPAEARARRTFDLGDLLGLSQFVGAAASPTGRYVAVQIAAPYDQAFTYADETSTGLALNRVAVVDTAASHPALRFVSPRDAVALGPFSPGGGQLLLYRFVRGRLEAGVLNLASGRLRWLAVVPERGALGRMAAWLSERDLLLVSPRLSEPPMDLAAAAAMQRVAALWSAKAAGRPAVTVQGAGRFAELGRKTQDRLLRIDTRTGARRVLARGDIDDIEPSPDGQCVAMIVRAGEVPLAGRTVLVAADDGWRRRLSLIDTTNDRATVLAGEDILPGLLDWAVDGSSLLVFGRSDSIGPWDQGRYLLASRDGRATPADGRGLIPVLGELASDGRKLPKAAWLGQTPLVLAREQPGGRQDWWRLNPAGPTTAATAGLPEPPSQIATRDTLGVVLIGDTGAWRLTPEGGATRLAAGRELANAEPPELDGGYRKAISPTKRGWALASQPIPEGSQILRLGAEPTPPVPLLHDESVAAAAREGLVTWRVGPDGVGDLDFLRNGQRFSLLRLNRSLAGEITSQPREIDRKGTSGAVRRDWLYLPPAWSGGPPPALLVLPYPGARHDQAPVFGRPGFFDLTANPQLLAAHGYAVLIPSLPRAEGQGAANGILDELESSVRAAVATGLVDRERIAVWGHSFGGYAALLAATRSRLFKAVIAQAAPSDLFSAPGASDPKWRARPQDRPSIGFLSGWSEGGQAGFGEPAWRASAAYLRDSPLIGVDAVSAPILLLHGDQDFISITQPEEFFAALRRLDKDVVLATFWGEDHLVESPGNVRALYRVAFDFLDHALGTAKAPPSAPGRFPAAAAKTSDLTSSSS